MRDPLYPFLLEPIFKVTPTDLIQILCLKEKCPESQKSEVEEPGDRRVSSSHCKGNTIP